MRFLADALRSKIRTRQATDRPALTSSFQSSIPGLYFVGPAAAASFGPLLRFAAGSEYAAGRPHPPPSARLRPWHQALASIPRRRKTRTSPTPGTFQSSPRMSKPQGIEQSAARCSCIQSAEAADMQHTPSHPSGFSPPDSSPRRCTVSHSRPRHRSHRQPCQGNSNQGDRRAPCSHAPPPPHQASTVSPAVVSIPHGVRTSHPRHFGLPRPGRSPESSRSEAPGPAASPGSIRLLRLPTSRFAPPSAQQQSVQNETRIQDAPGPSPDRHSSPRRRPGSARHLGRLAFRTPRDLPRPFPNHPRRSPRLRRSPPHRPNPPRPRNSNAAQGRSRLPTEKPAMRSGLFMQSKPLYARPGAGLPQQPLA